MQYWLNLAEEAHIWNAIESILPSFHDLSLHKYGSNVMEALVLALNPIQQIIVLDYVLEDYELCADLCTDPFGNYVVQKLLGCGTKTQYHQV